MKKVLCSVLFILFILGGVYAEPSKTIQHLMNDSVSMLDWGIYQMRQEFNSGILKESSIKIIKTNLGVEDETILFWVSIRYDWTSNLIIFTQNIAVVDNNYSFQVEEIKNVCNKLIKDVKKSKDSMYAYFTHNGFTKNQVDVEKDILNYLKISISIKYWNTNDVKSLQCESMISSDKILFSE